MITTLYIDNFKSLREFKIDFTNNLTVLIGTNSVGKSSVLQAIDLLHYFGNNELKNYLKTHNWKSNELKSKLNHPSKRNMNFKATFKLEDFSLSWDFTLQSKNDELVCVREKIIDLKDDKVLLNKDTKKIYWYDFNQLRNEDFPEMLLSGSLLSLINVDQEDYSRRFPQLYLLKKFILGIKSFELLSPDYMRKTSRHDASDLGIGGERLGAFLHNLSQEKKEILNQKLKNYYPYLDKVITQKKQYGYVHLSMNEQFEGTDVHSINSNYLSDGLLRIIAIVSLSALSENHKILLLDEIEDGINPSLAADLVNYLKEIGKTFDKQIVITTHSPVILDYFDPDSINFLWRSKNGTVLSSKMFESQKLKRHLDYMSPGEVWLNVEQSEIEIALENSSNFKNGDSNE